MNNRLPVYILAILVLVALIWRAANPPVPPPPGPLGVIPNWDSLTKVGDMVAFGTNHSGTMWAGAWNEKTRTGQRRSAVWFIDLEKPAERHVEVPGRVHVSSLFWKDDHTAGVLTVDAEDPTISTRSVVVFYDARTGKQTGTIEPSPRLARVLAWQPERRAFVGQVAGLKTGVELLVFDENGAEKGKPVVLELPAETQLAAAAALSSDAGLFAFGAMQDSVGGSVTYYFADAVAGVAKKAFTSDDLPGRVEGLYVSSAGILVVTANRDKFDTLAYDAKTGKIGPIKAGTDLNALWPDAPKTMMFVSYTAGYEFDLATAKAKRIFSLGKKQTSENAWRQEAQDGRLYARKDGNFTSIAHAAKSIDIRVVDKKGKLVSDVLPRR